MPTALEQAMPVFHFRERHTRWIDAEPARVWQVLTSLTLDQLTLTRWLVAMRHLGRQSSPPSRPLLTSGPVRMFELKAPTYALGGNVSRAWQFSPERRDVTSLEEFVGFDEPGWVKCLLDFDLQPRDGGVQLSTETRGHSTDQRARRLFAAYWAVIRPGSGLIRRDMLATIARVARLEP